MSKISDVVKEIGKDIGGLSKKIGNLASLNTTAKNSIVEAINEALASIGSSGGGLNDTQVTTKIQTALDNFKTQLMGGQVAAELDTLKEIADKIGEIVSKDSTQDALLQTLSTLSTRLQTIETELATDFLAEYKTARDS